MRKEMKLPYRLFPAILLPILMGCAMTKPMYYWDGYSQTLYDYKKAPGDETLAKHKASLEKVLSKSAEKGLRVPPGIYCEYGYLLLKEGKEQEALKFIDLEGKTYPESAFFVEKLKSKVAAKEGEK